MPLGFNIKPMGPSLLPQWLVMPLWHMSRCIRTVPGASCTLDPGTARAMGVREEITVVPGLISVHLRTKLDVALRLPQVRVELI